MLAGAETQKRSSRSEMKSEIACDRSANLHSVGYRAWVSFLAVALLATASTAARDAGGGLRGEVNALFRLTPNPARGAQIFSYCAGCHSASSNALPEGWVPNISGQHPRYLAKQLIDYRHSVRWDARMEPVAKGHGLRGTQDVADVVAFLAAQPADWSASTQHAAAASEDRRFYLAHCSSCHGLTGGGDNARYVPRIAGQDFAYLLRQMHDVIDGRRPNMRRQHFEALENLDIFQLVSLSHYLSRLGEDDGAVNAPEPTSLNASWDFLSGRQRVSPAKP